jgi:hypothetical protein
MKIEGLYYNFPQRTVTKNSVLGAQRVRFNLIDSFWVGRVGFNWQFA